MDDIKRDFQAFGILGVIPHIRKRDAQIATLQGLAQKYRDLLVEVVIYNNYWQNDLFESTNRDVRAAMVSLAHLARKIETLLAHPVVAKLLEETE